MARAAAIGDAQYSEDLYFAPLLPGANRLTLAVSGVQLRGDATAQVTIDLSGRMQGETFQLNREVQLGELHGAAQVGKGRGIWLDVDVDLGPEVDGRTLSSFSLDGCPKLVSSNGGNGWGADGSLRSRYRARRGEGEAAARPPW